MSSKELEAICIVFDVGSSTKSKSWCVEDFVAKAKNCIVKILLRKIFCDSKDLLSVVIAGSENTENDLADGGEYQNIEVLSPFVISSSDLVESVSKIQSTDVCVNWLDAVVVGIQCLRDKIEEFEGFVKLKKNLTKKKLVLLSSFISDVPEDQVDAVVEGLKDVEVELVVIGPDILKIDGDSDDSSTAFNIEKSLTKSQQLILKIYDEVKDKGTLCSCDDALKQLQFFTNKKRNRAAWNVNMSIGSDISIPIVGYKMLDDKTSVKWNLRSSNHEPVKANQSFFLGENEVDREDIISGYVFGSSVVPFSADDEEGSKYDSGERGLSLLFSVPSDEIPKHMFMGQSAYYIVGQKNNKDAQEAVAAIVQALSESDTVAVCRKVYRHGSSVSIGALFPKLDSSPPALIFVELPFKHDIQKLWFPSLNNVSVSDEQLNAVDKLIDDMDLSNFEGDDDPYHPENLYDPYEQYLYHSIAEKGFQSELNSLKSDGMEVPMFIQNLLLPLPEITEKSRSSLEKINSLFNLKVIERKSSVSEKADSSFVKDENTVAEGNENRVGNGEVTDFFQSAVLKVGTVNPESDFTTLLAKGEQFEKVCEQMQKVITDLLRRADNEDLLKKPLVCIDLLRKSCIDKKQPDLYNEWMKKIKELVIDLRLHHFWDKIIEGNLGLITTDEENSSHISVETANEFLENTFDAITVTKDEQMDIEDLLDTI